MWFKGCIRKRGGENVSNVLLTGVEHDTGDITFSSKAELAGPGQQSVFTNAHNMHTCSVLTGWTAASPAQVFR